MEIFMRNIPSTADEVAVALALQPLLHSAVFEPYSPSPINFKVYLFANKRNYRFQGRTGTLTLPSVKIGEIFLQEYGGTRVKVDNQYITMHQSNKGPRSDTLGEIRLFPYRDPRAIRETEKKLADLSGVVHLTDVQFCWECRDYTLSTEWKWNQDDQDQSLNSIFDAPFFDTPGSFSFNSPLFGSHDGPPSYSLRFGPETRKVIVKKSQNYKARTIATRYSNIYAVETDSYAKVILLYLDIPPSYEEEEEEEEVENIFRMGMGNPFKKKRKKLMYLNERHASVAPYTWNVLRLVCKSSADVAEFKRMAEVANIATQENHRSVDHRNLFHVDRLKQLRDWLCGLDWFVAFKCEELHKNMLLDTVELLELRGSINRLVQYREPNYVTQVLRQFDLGLRRLWFAEDKTVQSCFNQAKDEIDQGGMHPQLVTNQRSLFQCLHVTFTPTTMKLRGPFPDVSNRILRQYPDHHESFLRVSFTDEDNLQFRFDQREVDGPDFIQRRVGTILKKGFTLCGRKFEFLAYSQSALKEYTVWFVTSFTTRQGRRVDAKYIRESIGSSWPGDLRRHPAKFAARLSQAFTATESSVFVENDQIERIPDIERNGYCFSDGNGILSQEMADAIHEALQRGSDRMSRQRSTPSVFQVRIQGAKGVLSVNQNLSGLTIGLRPSMVKFESIHNNDIEIARSFNKPGNFFLNRPLIMILAGLGINVDVFLKLQRDAVEETTQSSKSLKTGAHLLETHGLGTAFSLPSVFTSLRKLKIDFEEEITPSGIRDPFIDRCMQFSVHHVLREIKFKSRVPVPKSWKLVGVVDAHNILEPHQIYACIVRGEGSSPQYIKGTILISKSPTIHPGDVQFAEAIGAPPTGSPLLALTNCVVFSQRGDRPLPNMLSGSDLDGDEYDLIQLTSLHPPRTVAPGKYDPAPKHILDRNSEIEDVADFVVNFINNDMLGIIAINFLLVADVKGIFASKCVLLANLHSWAVDFPKNGEPVPIDKIPFPDTRVKPDWYAPETDTSRDGTYYPSSSVLGKLFRDVQLPPLSAAIYESRAPPRQRHGKKDISLKDTLQRLSLDTEHFDDPISTRIRNRLTPLVDLESSEELTLAILRLFDHFAAELEHICFSYTLSRKATARLTEEEVFVGTIIAKSTQPRKRRDHIAAMRDESTTLVRHIWKELEGGQNASINDWVNRSWAAWKLSLTKKNQFGSKSFGWAALRAILEAIRKLEED
ncbi:RdRP-domain-containing protein [Ramaria rubella]|nr:RdRP-domain-containing protein [Ramaria rubella]